MRTSSASVHENVAIGALQRRAGDHGVLAGLADPVDLVGDRLQPGPAILIGERMAGAHLVDIAFGMKPVAILEGPAQAFGQLFGDGALAGAGHAHDDQRAGHLAGFIGHGNSPAAPPDRPARSSRRRNARGSPADPRPPSTRVRIARLSAPATSNSISRQEAERRQGQRHARHERLDMRLRARRPPSAPSRQRRDSRETARRYGRRARRPSARDRTGAGRVQAVGAVERFQLALVAARGFLGICAHRSESDGWCRPARSDRGKGGAPCAMLLSGSSAGDKSLVADEPVHAVPRNPASIGVGREQLIELFRARSAGQANRDAAAHWLDIRAIRRSAAVFASSAGSATAIHRRLSFGPSSRASASCGRRAPAVRRPLRGLRCRAS